MRMKLFLIFLFASFAEFFVCADMRMSQMVHEDKSQYEVRGDRGEMAHKFGVEVVPNSQFHHTTTDEDGVRMGCYGHIQDGKLYSTNYVADKRGYRIVAHHGLISVYPEYDVERKASFTNQFDVSEELSQNIRHFFPEGCKHSELTAQGSQVTPQRIEKPDSNQPDYTNRQPPPDAQYSESRHLGSYEPTPEPTIILPVTPEPTTERPYPVYDRTRDPKYLNPSTPSQNQQVYQETEKIEVIALPPNCETDVKLYYFNQFVRQDVCLKENCETLSIHLPIGTIHQNDLDQLSDIEILEKVLELLKRKRADDRLSNIQAWA